MERLENYSTDPQLATDKIKYLSEKHSFIAGYVNNDGVYDLAIQCANIAPIDSGIFILKTKEGVHHFTYMQHNILSYERLDFYYGMIVEFLLTQTGYYVHPLNAD